MRTYLTEGQKKEFKKEIMKNFDRYNFRKDIEKGLTNMGFSIWSESGKGDEQYWVHKKGDYGEILVLVNWVDGHYAIYDKGFEDEI